MTHLPFNNDFNFFFLNHWSHFSFSFRSQTVKRPHMQLLLLLIYSTSGIDSLICSLLHKPRVLILRPLTDGWTFSFRTLWWRAEIIILSMISELPGVKAAPDHHPATTMYDCQYDPLQKYSAFFFLCNIFAQLGFLPVISVMDAMFASFLSSFWILNSGVKSPGRIHEVLSMTKAPMLLDCPLSVKA